MSSEEGSKHTSNKEENSRRKTDYKDDVEDEESHDDKDSSDNVFDIKNLISFLKNKKITTVAIYLLDRNVSSILVRYDEQPLELLIYIPGKFQIRVAKREYLSIPVYNLEDDDDEDNSDQNPTLFNNQVRSEVVKNQKIYRNKALERFAPLLAKSKIKLAYLDKNYMNIIKYTNKVTSFLISNQNNEVGFYYTIDLDSFYALVKDIVIEVSNVEKTLNDTTFLRLQELIDSNKMSLNNFNTEVNKQGPLEVKKKYQNRTTLLTKVAEYKAEKRGVAIDLINELRKDNLKQMFKYEFIANVSNEYKNLE
jgi:hypothetical protein